MTMPTLPRIAIVDGNTLSAMGLRQLLRGVMPQLEVDVFGSVAELEANHPEAFVHYFVSMSIVLTHRPFFLTLRRQTIVLTTSADGANQLSEFHCLCISVPEGQLVRSLLRLLQMGHHGQMPPAPADSSRQLSDREREVMTYIVKGYINKEVADRLHIGLSTVVTHRRNIMEKLGVRSVSALTIYAVTHGYVDIGDI